LLEEYFEQQQRHFRAHPEAAQQAGPRELPAAVSTADAAAYTAVARVVLNLDEFITRE
jgi:hypothetical protein